MSTDFLSTIELAEVDKVLADGSVVFRKTDGNHVLVTAEQLQVAKIASDAELRGKLKVVGA